MGLSRYEHWSVVPFPPPGDLPDPGIKPESPESPALAGRCFTTCITWFCPKILFNLKFGVPTLKIHFHGKNPAYVSAPLEKPAAPGDPSPLPMTAVIWSSPVSASDMTFSSDPGPTPLPAWPPFLFTGDPDASPQVHIPAAPKCPGFRASSWPFTGWSQQDFSSFCLFSCICLF